ncbi:MAG: hypothetical protein H6752_10320 [Candidatus Omnitrophica bacterium]|nr:hypothetical protein [Candidatus Omnitrophota bacterium]
MQANEYGYDKVGNRTSLSIEAVDATTEISVDWTYEYNTLNQLKKRYTGASWSGRTGMSVGLTSTTRTGT